MCKLSYPLFSNPNLVRIVTTFQECCHILSTLWYKEKNASRSVQKVFFDYFQSRDAGTFRIL